MPITKKACRVDLESPVLSNSNLGFSNRFGLRLGAPQATNDWEELGRRCIMKKEKCKSMRALETAAQNWIQAFNMIPLVHGKD